MSIILCIESATPICSVALLRDRSVFLRETNEGFSHAEKLTVFISEVLTEAGIKPTDVDAIAVSNGPGSYTGLRIGVSVAKGLCFAMDKPLISISTLEAMAVAAKTVLQLKNNALYCPMIDARRMEVYAALFDEKIKLLHPPEAIVVTDALFSDWRKDNKIYFFGDGAEKCTALLKEEDGFMYCKGIFPSAIHMTELAEMKFRNEEFEDVSLFEPVYLKEYMPGRR